MSLFASRPRPDPARVGQIKDWFRARLDLPEDAVVLVTELRCTEPGCPPVETVVAAMDRGGAKRLGKIPRPLPEVTEADVAGVELVTDERSNRGTSRP